MFTVILLTHSLAAPWGCEYLTVVLRILGKITTFFTWRVWVTADDDELRELVIAFGCYGDTSLISHNNVLSTADISIEHQHYFSFTFHSDIIIRPRPTTTFSQSLARREISKILLCETRLVYISERINLYLFSPFRWHCESTSVVSML